MSAESKRVKIYTTRLCPYCHMAKELLTSKAAEFEEIAVDGDPEARAEMQQLSGGYTVPQVFIDGQPVGGCDDLYRLESLGKLDALLSN